MRWLAEHPWVTFIIIYILLTYVYNKVFKMKKLPILKELLIYLLIGVGAFMLLIFQIDLELPIVYSLGAAFALMMIVRLRNLYLDRKKPRNS